MHVSNSLSKLGFRSRTQLAAWAVARDGERAVAPAREP
jgi:DNA-binding NarL/FixJ family response regulator